MVMIDGASGFGFARSMVRSHETADRRSSPCVAMLIPSVRLHRAEYPDLIIFSRHHLWRLVRYGGRGCIWLTGMEAWLEGAL